MLDQSPEVVDIEREVSESKEFFSPEIRKSIVDSSLESLRTDLVDRAKKAQAQKEKSAAAESYIQLAAVQRDVALAINTIRQLDEQGEFHGRLVQIINQVELQQFVLGPVSSLTLHDLGKEYRQDSPPSIDDALARADLDALAGLDFVQYAGEIEGRRQLNLVQIKSSAHGEVDMIEIDGEHQDYLGVSARSAHKLKQLADELNSEKFDDQTEYRAFVVIVPAYDSRQINNLYGKVQAADVFTRFKKAADKANYFVTQKEATHA